MPEVWRLFIAIELPTPIIDRVEGIQDWLKQNTPEHSVRWVKPDNIHLTLKFLGDVPLVRRKPLEHALSKAIKELEPFDLEIDGLGCFTTTRKPRVIWLGLQKNLTTLHNLRDVIEKRIAPMGYPTEERPFHPHLTLGRVKREAIRSDVERIGNVIANSNFKAQQAWTISSVTLFRSELQRGGAVYTALHNARLKQT